jgi:hypothetical protein
MVRLAAALGLGLAAILVASAVIGQTPRNDGRFQRPDDAAIPAAAEPAPEESASGDLDALVARIEALEAAVTLLDGLAEGQAALGRRIAALQNAVDGLAAAVNRPDVDLAPVLAELDAIRRTQAELAANVDALVLAEPAPLPDVDLTAIEAELTALRDELEAAITRHDDAIEEALAGLRSLQEALLTELRRLTTPTVPSPAPPVDAGLSANGDNGAGEPPPADAGSVRGFGEELVFRLYRMVAGLRRGLAAE